MSKFWQKKYISKYTGEEIDAAVGNVPVVTSADAGKALVVDEEGKIVAGEAGGSLPVITLPEFPAAVGLGLLNFLAGATNDYTAKTFDIGDIKENLQTIFGSLEKGAIFALRSHDGSSPDMVGIIGTKSENYFAVSSTFLASQNADTIVKVDFLIEVFENAATMTVGAIAGVPAT